MKQGILATKRRVLALSVEGNQTMDTDGHSASDVKHHRDEVRFILSQAKGLAARYYALTGKPLGVIGEVAEFEAAEKLELELAIARTAGYDAIRRGEAGEERIQIKGRAVDALDRYRGRVPSINTDRDYETVLLVLLDRRTLDVLEIWSAPRDKVAKRLLAPGSKSRNERSSLGISQFKSIATQAWPEVSTTPEPVRYALPKAAPIRLKMQPRMPVDGSIGALVSSLLMDPDLNYEQIVYRVKMAIPTANTSTKSVVSTARDLRKRGVEVPFRR